MCMYMYLNIYTYKVFKVDLHIICIHIIFEIRKTERKTLDYEIWSNYKLFNEPFVI